jgi:hypothetical protein
MEDRIDQMSAGPKQAVKDVLGQLPYTAEFAWHLQKRLPRSQYKLDKMEQFLPEAVAQARPFAASAQRGKDIFIFATLHYWIGQAALIGAALAGMGHRVRLAYLPYANWQKPLHPFDLRRQNAYTRDALKAVEGLIEPISLLDVDVASPSDLPPALDESVRTISRYDTMYSLQLEEFDDGNDLYQLRLERNRRAAGAALACFERRRPDLVLVPNGTIIELGAVFRTARFRGIPTNTYEFNDQREHIWIGQNVEIMRQDTDALWNAKKDSPLTDEEWERIREFEEARQGARFWGKATRLWQPVPAQGAEIARAELGLDSRPVVLLPTNVLGDSLTLGRQCFTRTMSEWVNGVVCYFAGRSDVQLVIRIHPGESLARGPSLAETIKKALPEIPAHIHLIPAQEKVNTYDLVALADVGLAYTTTTGLEMAMTGKPVILGGRTHYRERGFTLDPNSWEEFYGILERVLADPQAHRLTQEQIETAWTYAYRFFFEFHHPFPWRLVGLWKKDIHIWPMVRVLGPEGQAAFGRTFGYLLGASMWAA